MSPLRPRPPELIEKRNVTPIDPDLEERARRLAAAAGYEFASSHCMTNAWFAALAAVERGEKDVRLHFGFRERGRPWSEDPHGWISMAGRHHEPSPDNDPSGVVYLELWTREPSEETKTEVFRRYETFVERLSNWAAQKA